MGRQKERAFSVYLHPEIRKVLDDLELTHGDKRSVINAALWVFSRTPLSLRVAATRTFARVDSGHPIETPDQKYERLLEELDSLRYLLAVLTDSSAPPNHPH